jgi:hypothetical protein
METEAKEENEVKLYAAQVKSAQRTFVAFASFCAKISPVGYEVRDFHALPARLRAVSYTESNLGSEQWTAVSGQWPVVGGKRGGRIGQNPTKSNQIAEWKLDSG